MAEGDYGIILPIVIHGTHLTSSDFILLTIKNKINGNLILEKNFSIVEDNTINFELTQAESDLLPAGNYVYSLDWYQNRVFMCNIIPAAKFKVVDKV